MHVDTQYGKDLISRFRPEQVSQLVTTGLKKSNLVVSRLRCDTPGHGFAEPHAIEPAFSVILQLREQPARELFLGERCVHRGSYPARTTSICNQSGAAKGEPHQSLRHAVFFRAANDP